MLHSNAQPSWHRTSYCTERTGQPEFRALRAEHLAALEGGSAENTSRGTGNENRRKARCNMSHVPSFCTTLDWKSYLLPGCRNVRSHVSLVRRYPPHRILLSLCGIIVVIVVHYRLVVVEIACMWVLITVSVRVSRCTVFIEIGTYLG